MPELKGELFGDKGRNREFDNSKIKNAVKDFSAETTFQEGIRHSVNFYEKNTYMQGIDYSWNARADRLITDYYKEMEIDEPEILNAVKNRDFLTSLNLWDRITYLMSFYKGTYKIYTLLHRIFAKIKYTLAKRKSLNDCHIREEKGK